MKIHFGSFLITTFFLSQLMAGPAVSEASKVTSNLPQGPISGGVRANELLSFKDWKLVKIQKASDKWSQEAAQDLSVTDYLFLYVTKQAPNPKFEEIAAKLSPQEMGQIIEALVATRTSLASAPGSRGPVREKSLPLSAGLIK